MTGLDQLAGIHFLHPSIAFLALALALAFLKNDQYRIWRWLLLAPPVMPVFMFLLGLFSFSSLAFPGTNSFVGEILVLIGAFRGNVWIGFAAVPGAMASDLTEGIEVQYHFSLLDGPTRLVLRLIVPHDAPDVPSIAAIYPGANWHECECFDFYGIRFVGHPDLHRLLLPEDFEGHPLLKAPEARRSLGELMPSSYCRACGLAEPDKPAATSAPAAKTDASDA